MQPPHNYPDTKTNHINKLMFVSGWGVNEGVTSGEGINHPPGGGAKGSGMAEGVRFKWLRAVELSEANTATASTYILQEVRGKVRRKVRRKVTAGLLQTGPECPGTDEKLSTL